MEFANFSSRGFGVGGWGGFLGRISVLRRLSNGLVSVLRRFGEGLPEAGKGKGKEGFDDDDFDSLAGNFGAAR